MSQSEARCESLTPSPLDVKENDFMVSRTSQCPSHSQNAQMFQAELDLPVLWLLGLVLWVFLMFQLLKL
jgi:hypothetical protein